MSQTKSISEEKDQYIEIQQLRNSLKEIGWTDETCKVFLASQYRINPRGSLEDVLRRLTAAQAGEFIQEISNRADQIQMQLFE